MDFKIKYLYEDFIVKEIPVNYDYCTMSAGKYTILEITKKGINTFELIEKLGEYFEMNGRDIFYCGLKDEDGITTQTIGLKKILELDVIEKIKTDLSFKKNNFKIDKFIGYTKEKLKIGKLLGNHFEIVIRNIDEIYANSIAEFVDKSDKVIPIINYYDEQRFGLPGGPYNTHFIGKAIIDENWNEAAKEFLKSNISETLRSKANDFIFKSKDTEIFFYEFLDLRKIAFYMNSYRSYLWNNNVSCLISENFGKDNIFKYVDDAINVNFIKKIRNDKEKLYNNTYEYKYYYVNNRNEIHCKCNEREVISKVIVNGLDVSNDECFEEKYKLRMNFFLKSGSYATMLIKQLVLSICSDTKIKSDYTNLI